MDSRKLSYSGDPRLAEYEQRKRKASRSPDGGQARKQSAVDDQRGNGTSVANDGSSRRSSISNGTSRHSELNGMSPNGRRTSTQINSGMQNPNRSVSIASLASKGSPRDDGTSGRSTPLQKPASTMTPATGPRAQEVAMSDAGTTGGPNQLLDLLTNFSSQVAVQAALQINKDQAEARFERAQLEYNELRDKFKAFPAIKERKAADRESAQRTLKFREEELKKHATSQQQLMGTLAGLIGQSAASQMEASSADFVSRADFDKLAKSYQELKQDINAGNRDAQNTRNELSQVKRNVEKTISDDLGDLKRDAEVLMEWKTRASSTLGQINVVQGRVDIIAKESNDTTIALNNFRTYEVGRLATKKQVVELETKQETLDQKVAGVRKKNADLLENFGRLKLKDAQANINQQAPSQAPAIEALKEDIRKISTEHREFKGEVEKMLSQVQKPHGESEPTRINDESSGKLDLIGTLESFNERLTHVNHDIDTIKDNINEEGKDSIVKRVKNLDRIVNNMSVKIDIPLHQSVRQLEQGNEDLRKDVQATKTSTQPLLQSSGSVDLTPLTSRLTKVEQQMSDFEQEQNQKDDMIDGEFDNVRKELKEEIDTVKRARLDDLAASSTNMEDVRTKSEVLLKLVETKVSTDALESLKGDVSTLSEDFRKLQARQQRSESSPRITTPGQPKLSPQVPPPTWATSPQLPNGVAGSPHPNGVQQLSSHGSPLGSTGPQSLQSQSQEVQQEMGRMGNSIGTLQRQLDQLVGVTQHLKQRADNLQTDDVVRQMVDQMSKMYPDAKALANTHTDLKQRYQALSTRVDDIQRQKDVAVRQLNSVVAESTTKSKEAQESAQSVATGLQNATKRVNEVDALANHVNKGLSNLIMMISSFDEKIPKLEKDVDNHENRLKLGETGITQLDQKMKQMKADIDAMLKQIGEGMGKIQTLEKFQ